MAKKSLLRLQQIALDIAREAHEENFSSRRGSGSFENSPGLVYLYDNNPYNDPGKRPRDLAALIAALAKVGITEKARASYPPEGDESAGYTVAIIFDVSGYVGDGEEALDNAWREVLTDANAVLSNKHLRLVQASDDGGEAS